MDTFAALALATDPATKASLDRKPDRKNAPLITVEMLKMILIQAVPDHRVSRPSFRGSRDPPHAVQHRNRRGAPVARVQLFCLLPDL
jgi:hypothetical protein